MESNIYSILTAISYSKWYTKNIPLFEILESLAFWPLQKILSVGDFVLSFIAAHCEPDDYNGEFDAAKFQPLASIVLPEINLASAFRLGYSCIHLVNTRETIGRLIAERKENMQLYVFMFGHFTNNFFESLAFNEDSCNIPLDPNNSSQKRLLLVCIMYLKNVLDSITQAVEPVFEEEFFLKIDLYQGTWSRYFNFARFKLQDIYLSILKFYGQRHEDEFIMGVGSINEIIDLQGDDRCWRCQNYYPKDVSQIMMYSDCVHSPCLPCYRDDWEW